MPSNLLTIGLNFNLHPIHAHYAWIDVDFDFVCASNRSYFRYHENKIILVIGAVKHDVECKITEIFIISIN